MGLVYLPTNLPSKSPIHVGKSTSPMDGNGYYMLYILPFLPGLQSPIPNLSPTSHKNLSGFFQSCVSFNPKSQAKNGETKTWGKLRCFCFVGGGSFQIFSHFHLDPWGRFPCLTNIFQLGWFDHQLVTWKNNCEKSQSRFGFRWTFVW